MTAVPVCLYLEKSITSCLKSLSHCAYMYQNALHTGFFFLTERSAMSPASELGMLTWLVVARYLSDSDI